MLYKGIVKKRKKGHNILLAAVTAALIALEFMKAKYIFMPITFLVFLACFFEKNHIISEEGVDIERKLFGHAIHNVWKWEEITTLHADYRKARPDVMLHIGKDIVTRSFVFKVSEANASIELAKKMNPKIYIRDIR